MAGQSLSGVRVARELTRLIGMRGKPHIDLKNGDVTAPVVGWPIAAARNAAVVFMKGEQGKLSLVRLNIAGRDDVLPAPAR